MNKKTKDYKDSNEDNKVTQVTLVVITVLLFIGLGFLISKGPKNPTTDNTEANVEIRDGVQYVNIDARGGYSPRVSIAKAGIPTKLIMNTKGAFDCSAALSIPEIGYQKMLPPDGTTEIDLGIRDPGKFQGLCSMGMYNFEINFES